MESRSRGTTRCHLSIIKMILEPARKSRTSRRVHQGNELPQRLQKPWGGLADLLQTQPGYAGSSRDRTGRVGNPYGSVTDRHARGSASVASPGRGMHASRETAKKRRALPRGAYYDDRETSSASVQSRALQTQRHGVRRNGSRVQCDVRGWCFRCLPVPQWHIPAMQTIAW